MSFLQRASIRSKLLAMVLMPLLVVLPVLGLMLLVWGNSAFERLLVTKVRADLAVATGYFERVLGDVGGSVRSVADSHALHGALVQAAAPDLVALLQQFKAREGLDFINLRAPDGRLLFTDAGPADGRSVRASADSREAMIEILPPAELALLAPALRARVAVPLVATRNAAPTGRREEDRAMVVLAGAPVLGGDGRLLGHVQGGVLLNRNLAFIDHINGIVYPEGSLPFGSQGTTTLFLGDVRIGTNVRLFGPEQRPAGSAPVEGDRAIGTRVSQEVRDAVLGRGGTWLGSAFVVNDRYVSAYAPVTDRAGERIGMLYVGYLERPFTVLKFGVLAAIAAVFFAVMIAATVVSLRWARGIFQPLERMAGTMAQVEAGRLDARVGVVASRDEIGRLAGHLDHLLDVIADKTEALQRWGDELDLKVAQRTRDLEIAQGQLLRSEKLATVGQLTASIAHEVNNPIAVIQGNLDLVRELLGPQAEPVRAELALVDQQIERVRLIVTQLLQFARPNEYAGYVDEVDTARAFEDCLVLVAHLLEQTRIELQRDYAATRRPAINRGELQQVIVNLLVNAIHVMPEGGTLRLASRDAADDGRGAAVELTVADTGPGLPGELLEELFQPFVTRKKDGTGLGLWISRSIVERYGGEIVAANRQDGVAGASFALRLRVEPPA
ncbi:MAG TPA: cache domain-containing protein [Ideonella sp.]|nr:cache domain-containing protein [Ideonella sp.]